MTISEIKSALEKAERQLKAAGSQDEKDFAQKKIDKLNGQLVDAEKADADGKKKAEEPAKKSKKSAGRPKGTTKEKLKTAKPKSKKFIEYKGVKYYEGSDEYCRLGKKMIEERKKARVKSQGKYKTKSVSYKIGEDIADAVEKAVKSVSIADVKESPDKYVKRFRDLLKAGETFVTTFRAVLGEEYDSSDIKDSLDTVKALIDDIKKKVKTSFREKMAKGGSVSSNVNELVNGYLSAVLFAEYDENEDSLDANYGTEDFSPKTVSEVKKMMTRYAKENKQAIEDSGMGLFAIGSDIWYTQKGHGVGFFDRALNKDVEEKLTNSAKEMGRYPDVEVGDDGKIHLRGINK